MARCLLSCLPGWRIFDLEERRMKNFGVRFASISRLGISLAVFGSIGACGGQPEQEPEGQVGIHTQALAIPDPPAAGCISQVLVSPQMLYIAPTGNDANAGTQAAPLATLAGAHAKIVLASPASGLSSDWLIYARGGTYHGQHVWWTRTAPNHRIQIRAFSGETPVFDGILAGESKSRRSRFFDLEAPAVQATNVTIDGLTVQNYVQHGIRLGIAGDAAQAAAAAPTCNVITNNHLANIGDTNGLCSGGIIDATGCVPNPDNLADQSCECLPANNCLCKGYGALDIAGSSKNVLARNTVIDCINGSTTSGLIHAVYTAHASTNNLIQENYIRNVSGSPLKFRNACNDNTVLANYVERAGTGSFAADSPSGVESFSTGIVLKDNLLTFGYNGDADVPLTDSDSSSSFNIDANQSTGTFFQGVLSSNEQVTASVTANIDTDINNDGKPETFLALYYPDLGFTKVVYSTGGSLLSARVAYSSSSWKVTAMTAGDFDGSGVPQIITAFEKSDGTQTQVQRGLLTAGTYKLVGGGKLLDSSGSSVIRVTALAAGTFSGTTAKLYSASSSSGTQSIVRGNGVTPQSGSTVTGFNDGTTIYSSSSWTMPAMTTGKIDASGNLKLITAFHWVGTGSPKNRIYIGDATATNGATNGGTIFDNGAQTVRALATGKFDGTNERLISAYDDGGVARLYLSGSTGTAQATSLYSSSSWAITALAAGNVDSASTGDEIVTSFDSTTKTQVHAGDGTASATNVGPLYVWP
jgi:hypothetical protein